MPVLLSGQHILNPAAGVLNKIGGDLRQRRLLKLHGFDVKLQWQFQGQHLNAIIIERACGDLIDNRDTNATGDQGMGNMVGLSGGDYIEGSVGLNKVVV